VVTNNRNRTGIVTSQHRPLLHHGQNQQTQFLIDTGSDLCVSPRKLIPQLRSRVNYDLSAANGTTIPTYGWLPLSLNLELRLNFTWRFVVADVTQPLIGADFLSHYGLLVDCKYKRLLDGVTSLSAPTQAPIHDVLSGPRVKSSHPLAWTPELHKAFDECKENLSRATLLAHPDVIYNRVLIVARAPQIGDPDVIYNRVLIVARAPQISDPDVIYNRVLIVARAPQIGDPDVIYNRVLIVARAPQIGDPDVIYTRHRNT
jgi:hypothetical protein